MPNKSADISRRAVIVVAAGRGERAGFDRPKQHVDITGRPMIQHTLDRLSDIGFARMILVVAGDDAHVASLTLPEGCEVVAGGATRSESVAAGMAALSKAPPDHVHIHDGARPFVTAGIVERLEAALGDHDGAAPMLPVVDAIKRTVGPLLSDSVPRDGLARMQTPQAFRFGAYAKALAQAPENAADDVETALSAGLSVAHVEGDEGNIKLTYPADFSRAEARLSRTRLAVGTGYDVHATCEGDHVWLCGVRIDAAFGLLGHSDADVGLHALVDALLGALAEGDIGDHFPPSDPQWKGAASWKFLDFARRRVEARRGRIAHVDVTLICEAPKVKPHRDAMRARVAEILHLPLERVGLKATTTEKLGFTGRGEGLAAQAVASVELPDVG